jgi:hypothetical protein
MVSGRGPVGSGTFGPEGRAAWAVVRTDPGGWWLKSLSVMPSQGERVTANCLRHATCPVVVVPPGRT